MSGNDLTASVAVAAAALMGTNIGCSCRGPGFCFQDPHGCSKLLVASVLEDPMTSSGPCERCMDIVLGFLLL